MINFDEAVPEYRVRYRPKNADGEAGRWYVGPEGLDEGGARDQLARARRQAYEAVVEERFVTAWQTPELGVFE